MSSIKIQETENVPTGWLLSFGSVFCVDLFVLSYFCEFELHL